MTVVGIDLLRRGVTGRETGLVGDVSSMILLEKTHRVSLNRDEAPRQESWDSEGE